MDARIDKVVSAAVKTWPEVYSSLEGELRAATDITLLRQRLLSAAKFACDHCTRCELHSNRLCSSVFGDGEVTSSIFVISEGPGQYEARTGVPFTFAPELTNSACQRSCENFSLCFPVTSMRDGKKLPVCQKLPVKTEDPLRQTRIVPYIGTVARFFDQAIEGLFVRQSWGKEGSPLYITNVVKCHSLDGSGEDLTPVEENIQACRYWLDLQLRIIQPKIVLLLGIPACCEILDIPRGEFRMLKHSGSFLERTSEMLPKLPKSVTHLGMACHPSYISRNSETAAGRDNFSKLRYIFEQSSQIVKKEG